MNTLPLIYVAAPYSSGDTDENVDRACAYGEVLRHALFVPFIPHLAQRWDRVSPQDYEYWMDYDFDMLTHADAVVRLPGYSPGADREVAQAIGWQIPVVYAGPEEFSQENIDSTVRALRDVVDWRCSREKLLTETLLQQLRDTMRVARELAATAREALGE
jgi:hypothetical protein